MGCVATGTSHQLISSAPFFFRTSTLAAVGASEHSVAAASSELSNAPGGPPASSLARSTPHTSCMAASAAAARVTGAMLALALALGAAAAAAAALSHRPTNASSAGTICERPTLSLSQQVQPALARFGAHLECITWSHRGLYRIGKEPVKRHLRTIRHWAEAKKSRI
jgi:hypothetical protein